MNKRQKKKKSSSDTIGKKIKKMLALKKGKTYIGVYVRDNDHDIKIIQDKYIIIGRSNRNTRNKLSERSIKVAHTRKVTIENKEKIEDLSVIKSNEIINPEIIRRIKTSGAKTRKPVIVLGQLNIGFRKRLRRGNGTGGSLAKKGDGTGESSGKKS